MPFERPDRLPLANPVFLRGTSVNKYRYTEARVSTPGGGVHVSGLMSQQFVGYGYLNVWVSPDHLVSTATYVLVGHGLRAMGVIDNDRNLIGVVTLESLDSHGPDEPVSNAMLEPRLILHDEPRARQAADQFVKKNVDYAPLLKEGKYAGMVTSHMLLAALRTSFDPLTGLPWADALRNWGIERLEEGTEIAIVFLDLNDFGGFNKKYGHVVGDQVLRLFAQFLNDMIDPHQDLLVRYGGDEFAIGTLRDSDQVMELMSELLYQGQTLRLRDVPELIQFSVGNYGGRRAKERLDAHHGAMLDNLINLASKDCLAKKPAGTKSHYVSSSELLHSQSTEFTLTEEPKEVLTAETNPSVPEAEPTGSSAVEFTPGTDVSMAPPNLQDLTGMAVIQVGPTESEATNREVPNDQPGNRETSLVSETPIVSQSETEEPSLRLIENSEVAVLSETTVSVAEESELPSVFAIQTDDSPNSLTHVALRHNGEVTFGVGLRMGRSLEDSVAYATVKALERIFTNRQMTVDSVQVEQVEGVDAVTIYARASDGYTERKVVAQAEVEGSVETTIARATIAAFFAE